ncbi:MAG: DUF134 domain-containing protein [Candidatus Thermoplasmatota archaeon]|nr:DUF134 domain-containing protein [Candidatus Thermoplasmatota archaeon]
MRWRHGQYRAARFIERIPEVTFFKPAGVPMWNLEIVDISYPEIEALRLVDYEGLTQEEAAAQMGISRRSLWSDLNSARKKVAYALSNGCALQITGIAAKRAIAEKEQESEKDA